MHSGAKRTVDEPRKTTFPPWAGLPLLLAIVKNGEGSNPSLKCASAVN